MKLHYLLAATLIASTLVACTSPASPVAAQQSVAAGNADKTLSVMSPEDTGIRIPAAELRQRILKLMDSLHSPQDTSAPQVAKALQMELPQHESGAGVNRATGITDEGWSFFVSVLKYGDTPGSRASIYLDPDDAGAGKVSSTCSFDLNAFVTDIEKMGYVRRGEIRFPGRPIEWPFDRGHNAAYIQQYQADDGAGSTKLCVYSISLG